MAVVSDCPLLLHGLIHVVDSAPELRRLLGAGGNAVVPHEVGEGDVVLLNLRVSVREICDQVARLHEKGRRVLVLSADATQTDLVLLIEAGARGHVSQWAGEKELLAALRTVASGRSYFSTNFFGDLDVQKNSPRITDREQQILRLVANGATDREIAAELNISEHTVHSHLDRLYSKTGYRRRADLTRLALQRGVAAAEPVEEG
ncbi:response regulator transcription factor [Streptomyces incarnatus]|uniref:response regulator transcription factor n=1 Tax=Streptomyces incarnatus TaxID=665007 RepID=UPI001AD82B95|nr:response regulator transcription factor [Streptomyces incarnatus]